MSTPSAFVTSAKSETPGKKSGRQGVSEHRSNPPPPPSQYPVSKSSSAFRLPHQARLTLKLIEAIIVESVPQGENALERAKSLLTNAAISATMKTAGNRFVITNDGGATLLQKMDECLSEVIDLRSEVAELTSRIQNIERLGLHAYFVDARERAFLTYLTDHVLNSTVIHGGNCIADAVMIRERRPTEVYFFQEVYGVPPMVVEELFEGGYYSVIDVLNTVGGLRLSGIHLEQDGNSVFQHLVELLGEGQYDAAQEVGKRFPRSYERTIEWL